MRGRLVRVLRHGKYPAGEYRAVWRGTNARESRVASGVYFAALETAEGTFVQRMILIK